MEIFRNVNIQKLENHFQFVKVTNNFLAFCCIPVESKISLIVKRNTEKSQYTIFDSETVSQIIRV